VETRALELALSSSSKRGAAHYRELRWCRRWRWISPPGGRLGEELPEPCAAGLQRRAPSGSAEAVTRHASGSAFTEEPGWQRQGASPALGQVGQLCFNCVDCHFCLRSSAGSRTRAFPRMRFIVLVGGNVEPWRESEQARVQHSKAQTGNRDPVLRILTPSRLPSHNGWIGWPPRLGREVSLTSLAMLRAHGV